MPHLIPSGSITGRRTLVSWYCHCGTQNTGADRQCTGCTGNRIERYAQVAAAERTVYYEHPVTGEIRRPMRADVPMHPKFAAQGFERREVTSMIAHEKATGSVHEATNFAPGSEPPPMERHPDTHAREEVIRKVVDDVRAAHQSGPWTMDQPLVDAPFGS